MDFKSITLNYAFNQLASTWLVCGIEQGVQTAEELYDAAQLPVDLDVLHPCRAMTHHAAISCPGAGTGPERKKTFFGLGIYISDQEKIKYKVIDFVFKTIQSRREGIY